MLALCSGELGCPRRPNTALGRGSNAARAFLLRSWLVGVAVLLATLTTGAARAQELTFPQIIKIRYEAVDPRLGGHFVIWVEREKIWYGLDSKLFPAAKSVEVIHVTPAPGTTTITFITVIGINSETPDFFHLSGNTRFKISGMKIVSSNLPQSP
jgi:hypothetical protein